MPLFAGTGEYFPENLLAISFDKGVESHSIENHLCVRAT